MKIVLTNRLYTYSLILDYHPAKNYIDFDNSKIKKMSSLDNSINLSNKHLFKHFSENTISYIDYIYYFEKSYATKIYIFFVIKYSLFGITDYNLPLCEISVQPFWHD